MFRSQFSVYQRQVDLKEEDRIALLEQWKNSGAKPEITSWWNEIFYVDVENGNDNNDGSSSAPFKTIRRAVNSVPVGGNADIILLGSSDPSNPKQFLIDANLSVKNKRLRFMTNGTYATIKPKVVVASIAGNNYNYAHHFILYNSYIEFHNDDWNSFVTVENPQKADSSLDWINFAQFTLVALSSAVIFRGLKINPTPIVKLHDSGAYVIGNQYAIEGDFSEIAINYSFKIQAESVNAIPYFATTGLGSSGVLMFRVHNNGIFEDFNGNSLNASVTDLISGVVKDANGIPRNIVSNIVL